MGQTLAESLRQKRIERNMSQQQLANALFVDRSSIAGWETGRRTPDVTLLPRIADCLGIDVAELFEAVADPEGPPRVMLVDDEKVVLSGSIPVLEECLPGASITGFSKPSAALAFARNNPVAIAFLDIELGTTSGLQLCRALLELQPRMNVFFLTAYMEYSFDAWSTGACGFMLKPITAEDLKKQLALLRYPVRGVRA